MNPALASHTLISPLFPALIYRTNLTSLVALSVQERLSKTGNVFLNRTDLSTEGIYRCEVSADSPSFQTVRREAEMRVFRKYRTSFIKFWALLRPAFSL